MHPTIIILLCLMPDYFTLSQGFQNKPVAAGAPAGATRFTAGYFV
jgi:hypothetical protein